LQNQFSSNTEVHVIDFFEVPISHVSEILVIPETFEPLKAGFEHYWITPHINRYGQCLYDVKFKGLPSFRYYTIYEIVNFCRNDKDEVERRLMSGNPPEREMDLKKHTD
jgi:hypothetical protein